MNSKQAKRHFPRFSADLPMVAVAISDTDVITLRGRCEVISENGLGAKLPGSIPRGEIVSLELHLPNSVWPVRVHATVRHSRSPHYGLEFLALNENQRRLIHRYCELQSQPARVLMIDQLRKLIH